MTLRDKQFLLACATERECEGFRSLLRVGDTEISKDNDGLYNLSYLGDTVESHHDLAKAVSAMAKNLKVN